jgi:ABC-2 type transport system ATP-binding protein
MPTFRAANRAAAAPGGLLASTSYRSHQAMTTATTERPSATSRSPREVHDDDAQAAMIEADNLSKFYGDFAACREVTFTIRRGEVAAFLGPNGAGKSTTMKLLTGYLAPSAGTARIAGHNMATDRLEGARRLGYLPENGPLYPEMTPRSLLWFFGRARGMAGEQINDRLEAVVDLCQLGSVIGKPIGKLSKGYRQRVGMAQVLLHEPDVLILDEPTAGLDPNQIREVRETIRRLGETKTILLSTHILQEVEAMCNRVIFINEGRLVFDGTPAELAAEERNLDERFHQLSLAEHL